MSKKFFLSFLLFFTVVIVLVFTLMDMFESKKKPKEVVKKSEVVKTYRYRKYLHVKNFYQDIADDAVKIGVKYNVPPAALLAIAGVESGYGRGYVAHITGNILSLGAKSNEAELPALYLPNLKVDSSKILYGSMIEKYEKDELVWKERPKSLKKDYRPKNIAGTTKELDFLDKNPIAKKEANIACLEDFAKIWINKNKKFKPFVEAREMLDEQVRVNGEDILFDRDINIKFIYMISGKTNSFNYRETWAPKVTTIMKNTGLVELAKALHVDDKTFSDIWEPSKG
jgi:hypothetical protein